VLRSRLSIIPQEPVLFAGTLRFNLDPEGRASDARLYQALECVHLKQHVLSLHDGLDALVSDGGENWSVGQRQLICLARAVLRGSTVLVCDESTASLDLETDRLMQQMLRTDTFARSTIITIAHRLGTIMVRLIGYYDRAAAWCGTPSHLIPAQDYDRVAVVDDGRIVEVGKPSVLLANPAGYLTALVDETGPAMASYLRSVANGELDAASGGAM